MGKKESLFSEPDRPTHIKMGFYGEAGSGKTYTAALVAVGIIEELRKAKSPLAKKPVYVFDTEKGSDWLASLFAKHDIKYKVLKSRSFVHLVEATKEAEANASVFIVDAVSHVWKELMQAYMDKIGKDRIPLQYWAAIKEQWNEFTTQFVNSDLHIIVCGRAQDKWSYVLNEDTGKKELTPVDTRMGGEKQMSYEPDTLIEMTNGLEFNTKGQQIRVHRGEVQKDRSDTIKGLSIPNPTFESFKSVWDLLDVGGKVGEIDVKSTSQKLVNDQDRNVSDRIRRRKIAIEELQNTITKYIPSRSAKDQQAKLKILEEVYGTNSWVRLTEDWNQVKLERLEDGIKQIEILCEKHLGIESKPVKGDGTKKTEKKNLKE